MLRKFALLFYFSILFWNIEPAFAEQWIVFEPGETRGGQVWISDNAPVVGKNVPEGCRVYVWTKFAPLGSPPGTPPSPNPRDYIEFMGGLRCSPENK